MYVTLLTDVKGLGKKTERVHVSDAYARNVIIPKKLGFVGEQSPFAISAQKATYKLPPKNELEQKAKRGLPISKESNEKGGLYEKFGEKECLRDLARLFGVKKSQIQLKGFSPIKQIGQSVVECVIDKETYSIVIDIAAK